MGEQEKSRFLSLRTLFYKHEKAGHQKSSSFSALISLLSQGIFVSSFAHKLGKEGRPKVLSGKGGSSFVRRRRRNRRGRGDPDPLFR